MVQAAGIILYRFDENKKVEFFVAHPGGPYWVNKDGWNFPKGRLEEKDKVWSKPSDLIPYMSTTTWDKENILNERVTLLNGAMREFEEETAIPIKSYIHTSRSCKLDYLGKIKQSSKKYVHAFACYSQWDIDINKCYANVIEMEYPAKSGKIIEIPENDKYCWMTFEDLKLKTNPKHLVFYEKILKEIINNE